MSLITTIAEFKNYVSVDINTDMSSLLPFVTEAELLYIKPLLGAAFYDELVADYDPDITEMTADNQAVMPFVQRSLAYYAAYLSVPQIGVAVGDMGIQMQSGQDSIPAPRWKIEQLQMNYIQQADTHAEKLLQFLEENASVTKYNNWYSNLEVNTKMSGSLVPSARIASQYIDINESRRIFLKMKRRITEVEQRYVKRMICQDQYDAMVTEIQSGTISAEVSVLIEALRPYVCKMALYLTLPGIRVQISHDGLTLWSYNDGVISKDGAPSNRKEELKAYLESLSTGELGYKADEAEIRQFITDNIADYPLIAASPCYTVQTSPGPSWQVTNSESNKHFSV